jgi:GT2 family glycosyltransferase
VRREVFDAMGGFRAMPFLEDVDFLRRLRRYGRFVVLPAAVVTSARRFLRRGAVRQQLRNILLVALFELGVPARRLARFYPHIR